ncbi:toll/interleukin-1 receptor domain-containing protein [Saccharopolyspora mangrovi]|uniref:Toll/interleukin-1 receptor domain-containing protein n=1 Tax=Saccharopolyspora mangrovi TaxID=3082379 RepID=A0ABU6ADY5_9PSEU|nr:toll/interleukin-1 receptor domain-containing protein [Saccharopolyspora sp. S2-29]MEB3369688.1 toll/interleukin-1 receptor domain-containing protein [Saccharopolyspora sp. S2-29]
MSVPQARTGARYWAFLSYSRADLRTARSLQRRLERFAVPPALQRPPRERGTRGGRRGPRVRGEPDRAAAGMLDERLRSAIDASAAMVLLASPDSARSRYVDLEVEHFLRTRGVDRLAIVAIGEGGQCHPPLPAALRELGEGPLWIDCRDQPEVGRRALVRIAAAVLGVDFDLLWGRHRRRRQRILAAWVAFVVLVAAIVGGALWKQNLAEQRRPERQVADFREWFAEEHDVEVDDPSVLIARTDDLNGDGLIDYVVQNHSPRFCGSAGCQMTVHVTKSPGDYREVLSALGDTTPRVRTAADGRAQIIITELQVEREPVYSVYSLQGDRAVLNGYEFCDGAYFEYCTPTSIEPRPDDPTPEPTRLAPDAVLRQKPDSTAPAVAPERQEVGRAKGLRVVGVLPDRQWYLVHFVANVEDNSAAFVPADGLQL